MKASNSRSAENNLAKFDTVVIGDNLDALVYAYLNDHHILFNNIAPPTIIDFFSPDLDLSMFGIENDGSVSKMSLWGMLRYSMSLAGKIINSQEVTSISVEDQKLNVFAGKTKKYVYEFVTLVVFNVEKIRGADYTIVKEEKNTIYDWLSVRYASKHDIEEMSTKDDFVNKVYFYRSLRTGTPSTHKDLVSVSYLSKKQLNSQNYSDMMVRMKIKKMMKERGVRGAKNGRNPNYPDRSDQKYKYRALGIEYDHRQVEKGKKIVTFEAESIDFVDINAETLISKHEKTSDTHKYLWRLL